jgi:hypothetical protein
VTKDGAPASFQEMQWLWKIGQVFVIFVLWVLLVVPTHLEFGL